jgi:hypothetical protein
MKKIAKISILCLFLTTLLFGQKYKTDFIISKADSIIKSQLGDTLFSYLKYDKNTYYEYESICKKTNWETLDKYKKTKGAFTSVDVRWLAEIPFPNCPEFSTIKGNVSVQLDWLLRPIRKSNLEFIPDIYWTKKKCNLISKEAAIQIAKNQKLEQGIEPICGTLKYDTKDKLFIWEIYNYLTRMKNIRNIDIGQVETIKIDAMTGDIKEHEIYIYGPYY